MNLNTAKLVFQNILEITELNEWDEDLLNLFFVPDVVNSFIFMKKRFGERFILVEPFRSKDIEECILYWINIFERSIELIKEFE